MNSKEKNCIACFSSISEEASLCPVCKSHQERWKNWLQYYAGISAIIIFCFSLLGWLGATIPEARRNLLPRDQIHVVNLSPRSLVILNNGERDIFLLNVLAQTKSGPSWTAMHVPIESKVKAGDYYVSDISHITDELHDKNKKYVGFRGVSLSEWDKLVSYAVGDEDRCLILHMYSSDSSQYRELKRFMGPNLNHIEVTAMVKYILPGQTEYMATLFPAEAILGGDIKTEKCRDRIKQIAPNLFKDIDQNSKSLAEAE